jgi:hypothetical protein
VEEDKKKPESKNALVWACLLSLILLVFFGWSQASKSSTLDLKPQWLWVAVLPILVAFVTGKYIGKFEGPGFKYEQFKTDPEMRLLLYAPPQEHRPTSEPIIQKDATAGLESLPGQGSAESRCESWTNARASEYGRTQRLFLVHVYEPSTRPNQRFDITIFVIRHTPGGTPNQKDRFIEIDKLEVSLVRRGTIRFSLR